MKSYFKWVNTARGIGIILVVLGHAITDTLGATEGSLSKLIFDIIYSFHMPLFFFLSGFVGAKALDLHTLRDKKQYIFSRFKRLMIPYFFIGLIYIPLKLILRGEISRTIDIALLPMEFLEGYNPNYQLWTLYALFISAIIVAVFAVPKKGYKWLMLTIAIIMNIFWIVSYCPINILNEVLFQFVFYVLGIIYRKQNSFKKLPASIVAVDLALFVAFNVLMQIYNTDVFKTLTGILGIVLICELCKRIESYSTPVLNAVGKYGMDIYIMANFVQVFVRSVFVTRLGIPGFLCCIMSVSLGIVLPIVVSKYIVRRFRIIRALVLGDFSK